MRVSFGLVLIASLSFVMTACGGDSLSDRVDVSLDPESGVAQLEVEMSDGLEVNIEGEFPIAEGYGNIEFLPATRTENAAIVMNLDVIAIIEDKIDLEELGFGVVNTLPNGARMPAAMNPPMVGFHVVKEGNNGVDAVIGLVPELQFGAMIKIEDFNASNFPQGVSICQNFRNEENVAFAAVCIFGPGDGTSGGVFVGANLGEVLEVDLPDLPSLELPSADEGLMAFSSRSMALSSAAPVPYADEAPQLKIKEAAYESSYLWSESRQDRRKKLKRKHLQKAKSILRVK